MSGAARLWQTNFRETLINPDWTRTGEAARSYIGLNWTFPRAQSEAVIVPETPRFIYSISCIAGYSVLNYKPI